MRLTVAGLSDVGRCRQTNQDQYLVDTELGVYAVADGMGGHAAGEIASDLAISALAESVRRSGEGGAPDSLDDGARRLRNALSEGNRRIIDSVVSRAEWRGMGTTVVAMMIVGDRLLIGNVGDSRAYLYRDGKLRQLTSDHSWVNEQVKLGLLTSDEAHRHPMRNIVTRVLGNQAEIEVDVADEPVLPGDVFMLCSDGLNGMLRDPEICEIIAAHADVPQQACRALVDRANANGGEDNITVVVMTRQDD